MPKTAFVVLTAGLGTRMKSRLPKVMHPLAGRPMITHLRATLETFAPERLVVVIGPEMEAVADAMAPHPAVVQSERLGTGARRAGGAPGARRFRRRRADRLRRHAAALRRDACARAGRRGGRRRTIARRPRLPAGRSRRLWPAGDRARTAVSRRSSRRRTRRQSSSPSACAIPASWRWTALACSACSTASATTTPRANTTSPTSSRWRAPTASPAASSKAPRRAARRQLARRTGGRRGDWCRTQLRARAMAGGATLIDPAKRVLQLRHRARPRRGDRAVRHLRTRRQDRRRRRRSAPSATSRAQRRGRRR